MKLFSALAIFLLAAALPLARAQQTPDDEYVGIYSQIQNADSLQSLGQPRQALAAYVAAQTELEKFQKIYPDWDQKIVSYRLDYLAGKISGLTAQVPPLTNAPSSTEAAVANGNPSTSAAGIDSQLAGLRAQLQSLQLDNATLEAKLKEALAVQPAAVDPGELARAQAQARSLMKENDLLKAGLAQTSATRTVTNVVEVPASNSDMTNLQAQVASLQSEIQTGAVEKLALENRISQLQSAAASAPPQPDNDARVSELTGEVSTLRARLAVDEAQAAPYTPEEQALLKQPAPEPAVNPDAAKKSVTELPAGSAELVAEAQKYFSNKQYDQAAGDYLKILQRDPRNALALGNLAAIELQQGRLDDAETHIKSALAEKPDDSYNLSILGYLKFQQQKYDDAFDALSRAAKLDPQNAEIQNYLGVTLSHKGLRAQAETALRRAIELNPNYAAAHNNLAVIYISEQPPAPALARFHYQKALDAGQPRNPGLEKMLADNGAPVNP